MGVERRGRLTTASATPSLNRPSGPYALGHGRVPPENHASAFGQKGDRSAEEKALNSSAGRLSRCIRRGWAFPGIGALYSAYA